jgi:hypothetical protein
MLFGAPGFIAAPEPSLLTVGAWPAPHDPIESGLRREAAVGCLGIELPTRRRNRVNGRLESCVPGRGFTLRVQQSFGNCPKYIQTRRPQPNSRDLVPETHRRSDRLGETDIELIVRSDTFFISSRAAELEGPASHGLDVSHRGGLPGFTQVLSERELAFPDYMGNLLFNTLGNILIDARVGLLFVDFSRGTMLHVSGRARIDWSVPGAQALAGVERLIFVAIEQVVWRDGKCPLTFDFLDYSPHLERLAAPATSEAGMPHCRLDRLPPDRR